VLAYNSEQFCKSAGQITSLCWASSTADALLTGHSDGAVLHWSCARASARMALVATYHVHEDSPRSAVESVSIVLGASPCIIVQGGANIDLPQSLSLIQLGSSGGGSGVTAESTDPSASGVPRVTHVPWFGAMQGFALVRPCGSFSADDQPSAVVTLTEGGLLCMFDLHTAAQEPLAPDFQAQPIVLTECITVRAEMQWLEASVPTCRHACLGPWRRQHTQGHCRRAGVADGQRVRLTWRMPDRAAACRAGALHVQ
jgi:hypothetical protein